MKIAAFDISIIETGYLSLDGGSMFGVVPKTLWSRTNPADELNRIILSMRLLLIKHGKRIILTDCGVGHKLSEKLAKIYNVDHTKHDLISGLSKVNIKPEQVTDVILTHLHFDHVGGATYYDSENTLHLTFANATHHIQKVQWEWALHPSEQDAASFMRENYLPVVEAGKLNLIDGPESFYPVWNY